MIYNEDTKKELSTLEDQVPVKRSPISFPNTIANPRTMMVKCSNTVIALLAMFTSQRLKI